jgi:hypothetical protein
MQVTVSKDDATLEEGVRRPPRQPLHTAAVKSGTAGAKRCMRNARATTSSIAARKAKATMGCIQHLQLQLLLTKDEAPLP